MRTLITGVCLATFLLSLFATDADARRRKRVKPHHPVVECVLPAPHPVSVFDQQVWQPAVVLPGLMSVAQAAMASSYTWKPEDKFPPVRVEWVHASELSSMDQQVLEQAQKPVIRPLSAIVWASFGTALAVLVGCSGLMLWSAKD